MAAEPAHKAVLEKNLHDVRARIAAACKQSGRDPQEVRLVAVTKTVDIGTIRELIELGQLDLAENRPQQLAQRAPQFSEPARWHFIGHLQRNKAESVVQTAGWIHSVDSLRLFKTLTDCAAKCGRSPKLMLEVNVSGEASKGGFSPEELFAVWGEIRSIDQSSIVGLMTMAPLTEDPEAARPVFRALRELRDRLAERSGVSLPELSMGMSGDFEVAVEEGATMVRVGSRLFEGLGKSA